MAAGREDVPGGKEWSAERPCGWGRCVQSREAGRGGRGRADSSPEGLGLRGKTALKFLKVAVYLERLPETNKRERAGCILVARKIFDQTWLRQGVPAKSPLFPALVGGCILMEAWQMSWRFFLGGTSSQPTSPENKVTLLPEMPA